MRVHSLLNRIFSFKKETSFDSIKNKSSEFNEIIKKDSIILKEPVYFRRLNSAEWQAVDALKTQLAHSIINEKITIKQANKKNYSFDLIRMSWVNKDGSQVIDSDERFESLGNGKIVAHFVNELARLALEVNEFTITAKDLKKK
jgi:hypothetical protein